MPQLTIYKRDQDQQVHQMRGQDDFGYRKSKKKLKKSLITIARDKVIMMINALNQQELHKEQTDKIIIAVNKMKLKIKA